MELLINLKSFFGDKIFKNKVMEVKGGKAKSNKVLCVEQLSRRIKEDLGLSSENRNDSDYTKYL
ncbi:hypothetical protein ITG10_04380 [Vibrio sp. ED004]|uniref:hypothetical protein n=1 Tax=unclassified Vibrio TaxID=2614977 RepID=UPI0002DAADE0|nr:MULTISPECIES: hypothetical protein [unclassified Vibrio]UPR57575.1 hypothetical protein ITG10_04380 [Vibrio sp. ED004]